MALGVSSESSTAPEQGVAPSFAIPHLHLPAWFIGILDGTVTFSSVSPVLYTYTTCPFTAVGKSVHCGASPNPIDPFRRRVLHRM
jgi:hypothetical protein